MFQLGLLESQGFAKPTNPLLRNYDPSCATKTIHICSSSNQHGCDEMNKVPIPPARPQFWSYFMWSETNPYIQILSLAPKPP